MRLVLGLMSPKKCENLLLDWANLDPERLRKRYPAVFGELDEYVMAELKGLLWTVWKETGAWHRDWHLFVLRGYYYQSRARINSTSAPREVAFGDDGRITVFRQPAAHQLLPPPPITEFEAAFFYLQTRAANRMRLCSNPDCSQTKYFLKEPTNPKQTTCCPGCGDVVRKAGKRRWWSENKSKGGKEIYASRGKS
jgi:hypothetical protein